MRKSSIQRLHPNKDKRRLSAGAVALKAAFFLHCFATPVAYFWLSSQHPITNSGLVATFLSLSSTVFGAVSNVALCKTATTLSMLLVSIGAWTAQAYLILRLAYYCNQPVNDELPFPMADRIRFTVIAAFGAFMHAYTFWLIGDASSTPGYNVLCLAPNKIWWIWTIQTLIVAYFVSLCVGSAIGVLRTEFRAIKLKNKA